MSIYSGKLRRLGKLGGSLTDKKPQLRVKITPLNDTPKVTLSSRGGFSAKWAMAGRFFTGATRPLDILYRFVAASVAVLTGRKSKAITAPAQEIEADSAPVAGVDAPLTARPVQEVTAHARPHAAVWARLAAYNRAAAVYIVKIFTGRLSRAVAAPGVLTEYRKRMDLERVSKAETAGSAIMESRFNSFTSKDEALANTAPAEETATHRVTPAAHTAKTTTAAAVSVPIDSPIMAAPSAKMATWIDPVVIDGILYLPQAYSATKNGNILEVE